MLERARNLLNLGVLQAAMGAHAAHEQPAASLALSRRLGDDHGSPRAEIALCHLAVLRSRRCEANTRLKQARELLATAGEDERIRIDYLQALLYLAAGRLDEAAALAHGALDLSRSAGIPDQEPECLQVLGQVHAARGDDSAAQAVLQETLALARQSQDRYQEALALLEQGQLATRQLEHEPEQAGALHRAADECLDAAAAVFGQLGATHDLRRCRRTQHRLRRAIAAGPVIV